MSWGWDWQHGITLLLVGAAVVYLTRHLLRTMTTEPGAGCGVSSGCGGCSIKTDRCTSDSAAPPARAEPSAAPQRVDGGRS
jgi:hypothetical protein